MPPKKKQPANAFYFFMLDRKAAYERNGEKFPNGLKDVADCCGPEWKVLPAEAKKKYEDMAKAEKARAKGDTGRKYTNQHRSFDSVETARIEEEESKQRMTRDIESTIVSLFNSNKIAEFKFYLIHANYFCILEGDMYFPAELAIAEFSLARGVEDVYHTIINAGVVPLGYRHDAMQKSENVHHVPLEYEGGEKQLYVIWKNIKAILERGRSAHGGSYPPLYTMPDNVNLNTSMSCAKSVIKHLSEDDESADRLKIYPLEKLFYELKNSCAERKHSTMGDFSDAQADFCPSIPFACDRLEDDMYNYTANIACSFHYEIDQVVNCSKSFVQRWAYLICDSCCHYLDITIVPGKHVPLKSDVSFAEKQRVKEREAAAATASAAHKPFTIVGPGGKQILTFKPVEPRQQPPLPQPRVQTTVPVPRPRPPVYHPPIDNSDENFPAIPIGRGRGRVVPRGGGGRGNAPMSFAAAMQSKK